MPAVRVTREAARGAVVWGCFCLFILAALGVPGTAQLFLVACGFSSCVLRALESTGLVAACGM